MASNPTATFPFSAADTDTDTDTADLLAPGTRLGRYEITRLVGRGGMGCVYEALHRDLGKRVAVKTLLPTLASNPESRARFLREGQAASRIRHPHVVDVTDVVADGATTYLVMEYLEGEDLGARIARRGPLPLLDTADILLPVTAAIAAAHDSGVIHRDLKPENIFLARGAHGGPCPKVVDFGISKVLGDPGALALTGTSTAFGTLYYLPPEQLRGAREADARSDQYALGTILYECLTGQRAFDADGVYAILKRVAEGTHLPVHVHRPDLPASLYTAIERALSVDPAARFPSVRALGAVLLDFTSPGVRARWAPVMAADLGEMPPPAPARPPADEERATEVAASGASRDAGTTGSRALSNTLILPSADEAAPDLAPARSTTPRLILVGVAIGAAVVAITSATSRTKPLPVPPASSPAPAFAPRSRPATSPVPATSTTLLSAHPTEITPPRLSLSRLPPPLVHRNHPTPRRRSAHPAVVKTSVPILD